MYQEEKAQLETKENNVYTMRETLGIPNGYQMDTQVRLGKDSIVKDNNNILSDKPTKKQFKPPTVEEVQAYCDERKNSVDAQKFVDYYTSNGWMVGRTKMKDWKSAVRTWERNGYNSNTKQNVQSNTTGNIFLDMLNERQQKGEFFDNDI